MARRLKHPGLQQKFERVLMVLLAGGKSLNQRELLEEAAGLATTFNIATDEFDDLGKNFANYAARAKDGGVIVSNGPWGGYQLSTAAAAQAPVTLGALGDTSAPAKPLATTGVGDGIPGARQHWESFLHLPLTVALSAQFSSRVVSLGNATDNVRWGNPDMLMLRPSALARVEEFDPSLDASTFRLVDVSPECILASIEVKSGLDRDRAKLLSAIAEAAANSRWANEAWLVFVDRVPTEQGLDEDVVSLARSVEVGLLEVRLLSETHLLRTIIHHAAPTRATLRIGELTRERVGVLREAQELLRLWARDVVTFLDVDRAEQKARLLLEHGLGNLRRQKGFTSNGSLADLLKPLQVTENDRTYVDSMLNATLHAGAIAAGVDVGRNLVKVLAEAADEALIKRVADAYRTDLDAFCVFRPDLGTDSGLTWAPVPDTWAPIPA